MRACYASKMNLSVLPVSSFLVQETKEILALRLLKLNGWCLVAGASTMTFSPRSSTSLKLDFFAGGLVLLLGSVTLPALS